ncbi:MAG: branched-chain amino acid ABC transporter permease [Brevefilum fermentans]|jgi:branched-chain amino acid transport system permease protein|uniref:Inner-membrane translocator n=1 Tax=Candidatus Brevifilum fermentans TaxID=1986204 RepID=A0A1Y6K3X8_9CHLR|nr:branched-chain amino acid ABC transporter permease [Brevefilum fermentans]MDI9565524.1 branched-chain amino acid ABC transporter permease [Chloroflexota bacterium]SMX54381.1 Inner-membrane translocator [Brevefilum fermentans]
MANNPNTIKKNQVLTNIKGEGVLLGLLIVLILFPFVMSLITGKGVNEGVTKFWQGQLIIFFIMSVFAMSYDLLMGFGGILSFGHAASFGGGAYAFALLMKHVVPPITQNYRIMIASVNITYAIVLLAVFLVVLLVSVLIGLLFAATSIRLKGAYFAMLTLALGSAMHMLVKATDFHKWTGADEGLHGVPMPVWLNPTQNRLTVYFISLAFLVICYLLMKRMVNSPTGRVIIANRENEDRMRMIGYNPVTYRTIAFVSSSIFAGFAGALYSIWNASATPTMVSGVMTVNALIITILGGMGTLVGAILGAAIMQVISQFFYTWFGARWPLVFGILFILIVMFLPYGIIGTWRLKKNDIKTGWSRLVDLLIPKRTGSNPEEETQV